jgi:tetratricopeptide (TPR) repeat protein
MSSGEDRFFRRYRFRDEDLPEVEREIAEDSAAAASGGPPSVILPALIGLGSALIPLDREEEAAARLEAALALARELGDHEQEIAALLHLATALQYLGEYDRAQRLFQAGLDASAEYGIDADRHFLLHHRGRCYAEQGRLADARQCLEQALALREQLGQKRYIASSRSALDDLDRLGRP